MLKLYKTIGASSLAFVLPVAVSARGLSYSLENPLSGITTLEGLLVSLLNVLLIIAVPIIVFFIIFAGFTYVTAQGNPEKIKQATRSLTYAIIGGVLILGGVAISQIIEGVVDSFRSDSNSIVDTDPVTWDGRGSAGGG